MSEYTEHLEEQHEDDPAPRKKGPIRDMTEVTVTAFLDENPWAKVAEKHGDAWVNALLACAYELWKTRKT